MKINDLIPQIQNATSRDVLSSIVTDEEMLNIRGGACTGGCRKQCKTQKKGDTSIDVEIKVP